MTENDVVFDSAILIQHARARNKNNSFLVRSLLAYYPNLSVISVYEIEMGAYRAGRPSDIEPLQIKFTVLPITEEIAQRAARLETDLIRRNLQIGIKDTFIAATCLEYDLPLLTVNVRHFDRVAGLQLIDLNTLPVLNE